MAVRPEVLAQLARMAGDPALRTATDGQVQTAFEANLDAVAAALVAEIAASDDVFDRRSAQAYLEERLRTLASILTPDQIERLAGRAGAAIDAW